MTKLLDLFAGTGSVTKMAQKLRYDVKSLDINQLKEAPKVTFIMDILNFRPHLDLGPNWIPDIIWASPPCTEYSKAKTTGTRDIEGANRLVLKTLKIISWATQKNSKLVWIIENPQTGHLKKQVFMQNLPFVDADYCAYGFPYRKRTRFWTNRKVELQLCPGRDVCPFIQPGTRIHKHSIGNGRNNYNKGKQFLIREKCQIPEKIVEKLIKK